MPTIDPTTPIGVQPTGFTNGYTLIMSDEFNSTTLDSKWRMMHDFADGSAPTAWDVNAGNNSALRMWWNGNTSTDNQQAASIGSNPWRHRFGFYEVRFKAPRGPGFFPGCWLYPMSNSGAENPDGQQQEIDIFELFSLNNGDWLVDTTNYRCKNAKFTVWTEGGGDATTQAGEWYLGGHPGTVHGYDSTLSTNWHTIGMRWDGLSMQWYFDGVFQGNVNDPWGTANNMQLVVILQLWWGPNGGNPIPQAGVTPSTASNTDSILWDYIRVWDIGTTTPAPSPSPTPSPTPTPPPVTFNAFLVSAPADGTTISGIATFNIEGDFIANAELLPATAGVYTPMYGRFTLTQQSNGHVTGTLAWDTTAITNGSISVRVSAFDQPPGGGGNEVVVMTRTYIVNNVAPTPSNPDPTMEFCFDAHYGHPRRRGR